jgi:hypothetical protein
VTAGAKATTGTSATVAFVSYDLAVWVGARPRSDADASSVYKQMMERMDGGESEVEPSPAIRAYVEALLQRWPDITDDAAEDSPWADGPLMANAVGDAIYFSMVWSRAEEASAFASRLADEHGLVCYDPQSESLRPHQTSATPRRSWFRRHRP